MSEVFEQAMAMMGFGNGSIEAADEVNSVIGSDVDQP
jgi:hypothetical protein